MNSNSILGLTSIFGGLLEINQGNQLSVLGHEMQASSFRQAGVSSVSAANYNNAVTRANLSSQLDSLGRDMGRFIGSQNVAKAASGFGATSKTQLEITNETLTAFERQIVDIRNASTQQQEVALFEARSAQAGFENRARFAEFQSDAGTRKVFNQSVKLLGKVPSLLGGL